MKKITLIKLIPFVLLGAMISGCGGGGSSVQPAAITGRFAVTIKWPSRSRLIPAAANSIKLTLSGDKGVLGTALLARPATGTESSTTFNGLSAGAVTLAASAFPNADGTGVAQAAGQAAGTVLNGKTTTITVSMDSTIASIQVTPDSFFWMQEVHSR